MNTPQSDPLEKVQREIAELRYALGLGPSRLLRRTQAAAYLGVGRTWFDEHIRADIPEISKLGVVLFDRKSLDSWADQHISDSIHKKRLLKIR